jgi:putative transposase
MRDIVFGNGGIFHVYNRGAGKRDIFLDDIDRIRFMKGLLLFNDEAVLPTGQALIEVWKNPQKSANPLVKILSYALMDNHYHLVLEQLVDGGISRFMARLGNGFTKYHNKRCGSKGVVFESHYQAVAIQTEAQFLHITRYVHLNPYDHSDYAWREGKSKSQTAAKEALLSYPWSSYRQYMGLETNPAIDPTSVLACFVDAKDYEQFVLSWVNRNHEVIAGLTIDDADCG